MLQNPDTDDGVEVPVGKGTEVGALGEVVRHPVGVLVVAARQLHDGCRDVDTVDLLDVVSERLGQASRTAPHVQGPPVRRNGSTCAGHLTEHVLHLRATGDAELVDGPTGSRGTRGSENGPETVDPTEVIPVASEIL